MSIIIPRPEGGFGMKRKKMLLIGAIILILGAALSYEVMLWFVNDKISPSQSVYDLKDVNAQVGMIDDYEDNEIPLDSENQAIEIATSIQEDVPITIDMNTKIVYQYYYQMDKKIVSDICEPSQEMLNLTRLQLEAFYQEWEVFSFSKEQVILRKIMGEKHINGYYVVREYKGMITVFYNYSEDYEPVLQLAIQEGKAVIEDEKEFFDLFISENEEKYIREILDTPINLLSEDEQFRLKEGIIVYGDEELMRILENYSS